MEGDRGLAARVPARLKAAEGRRFGLTVGGAFLVLAAVAWWRGRPITLAVLAGLGAGLTLAALALPTRLGPLQRGWMALAHAISRVTTPIFMGIVYFLVISPMGVVLRALGKNSLVRPEREAGFWVDRSAESAKSQSMERQF